MAMFETLDETAHDRFDLCSTKLTLSLVDFVVKMTLIQQL